MITKSSDEKRDRRIFKSMIKRHSAALISTNLTGGGDDDDDEPEEDEPATADA